MRHSIRIAVLALLPVIAASEASGQTSRVDGYVFAGPGKFTGDSVNFGAAGAEFISAKGLGLGLESGLYWGIGPYSYETRSERNRTFGVHFVATKPRSESSRFAPFFIGGVHFFSNPQKDSDMGFLIGAGSNIWLSRHLALRLDGRIPLLTLNGGGGTVGIGITVR